MKQFILIIILLALSYSKVLSQGCLSQGITFTTQAQIDNFQTNYPGCTEIEGSVTISGTITNLDSLGVLTSVGGDLNIMQCIPLTTLKVWKISPSLEVTSKFIITTPLLV